MGEMKESEKVYAAAASYYRRKDIQKALVSFSQNREAVPRYFESFGKRPDTLQYDSDVLALAEKGATSFHASQELWRDPLQINLGMNEKDFNDLRIGWDLIIDIDTKYIEYAKIAAELIMEALKFHNVHSFGIKFSGRSGFHIGVSQKAFPQMMGDIETRTLFPEGPRAITKYLHELIKKNLLERISELSGVKVAGAKGGYAKDLEGAKKVMPDLVLVSPRHLFRMPYSLHERTALASIVLQPEQIRNFQPGWAKPELIHPKQFLPEPEGAEGKELLLQALDFSRQAVEEVQKKPAGNFSGRERVVLKDLSPAMYPPCITAITQGIKQDGRKRALFVLMNFYKSVNLSSDEIEKKVADWNKTNYKPLRDGYVRAQISWFKKQKAILPPNCDKSLYEELAICHPDGLCGGAAKTVKNPVNYVVKKVRLSSYKGKPKKKKNE